MTSLNPLDLVPLELQTKYLPLVKAAFAATSTTPQELGKIATHFAKDGGTALQWDTLKFCAANPR